jgi:hypothetical protein
MAGHELFSSNSDTRKRTCPSFFVLRAAGAGALRSFHASIQSKNPRCTWTQYGSSVPGAKLLKMLDRLRGIFQMKPRPKCHVDAISIRHPTTLTTRTLVALANQSVDGIFPVTHISALNIVLELSCLEATCGVVELERPQEIGGLLEIWPNSKD